MSDPQEMIIYLRDVLDLTFDELGAALGIGGRTAQKWSTGEIPIGPSQAARIVGLYRFYYRVKSSQLRPVNHVN